MALWIKDPLACLAENAERGLVVDKDKIVELVPKGKEPKTSASVFDACQHVVLPGLVNTHHHMYQNLTRAHPNAINKELFGWLTALFPLWSKLTSEHHRLATRLALTELLMSGCTTAADHHYLFTRHCTDAVDIQVEEAKALGMRMMICRGSMDLSQKDGAMPPDSVVQDRDTILNDCERVLRRYHQRGDGAMIQIALAPCTPFTASKELMMATAKLAEEHDCRLHTHIAETRDETDYCLAHLGYRPVDYLEETGWMTSRVWLAHGIFFNDDEVVKLGQHGLAVCHCPTSNMMLASGHCRTRELERAGVSIGLGVDGSSSNDSSNLLEGVRHALMINRLTYDAAITHLDVLHWATRGSARCLGRNDIGDIAVGKQADLALIKLDELRFSGVADPLAGVVLCGAHRADRVMIAGEWRLADGLPINTDVEKLRHDHSVLARKMH
jgi:8-oxoguanine deaminase